MTDGEPKTAVSTSLQKIKSIRNQHNFFPFKKNIKSQTSDSFVSHFDGHFAYLKTLDFSFKGFGCRSFSVQAPRLLFMTPVADDQRETTPNYSV